MADEPDDQSTDPFAPPLVPCEVVCLHCGESYDSWQIEWRILDDAPFEGAWCCPTPGCCAVGYGFDILPTEVADFDDDDEHEDEDDAHGPSFEDGEDDREATILDGFGDDAIWIGRDVLRRAAARRRPLGDTPQPPFDRKPAAADDTFAGYEFRDDDIPF